MVEIGRLNSLTVLKEVSFGVYLDAEEWGEVLLPVSDVPENCAVGDVLSVFLYFDSEDQLIATTRQPKAQVGDCVAMTVDAVNEVGAFLDWGLAKQLLVPFSEQPKRMQVGERHVVYVYIDDASKRIVASSRLNRFLPETSPYLKSQQAVSLLFCGQTDLGYKAVVNQSAIGLLFHSDAIRPIHYGETLNGFIKQVRPDGKLDLCLQLVTREALDALSQQILRFIEQQGGKITLTDKSSPQDIMTQFGVSKSSYKKALGKLYKQRLILIEPQQIVLVK